MFRVYCSNKGCNKEMMPLLNLETNEVECTECNKPTTVTEFAKKSMKSMGQIKRIEKSQQPFSVECKKCKKILTPKIDKNNDLACAGCATVYDNISPPFANLIRQKIK